MQSLAFNNDSHLFIFHLTINFNCNILHRSQLHVMRLVDELGLQLYEQSYDGKIVNILSNKKVAYTSSPVHLILTSFWMAYDLVKGFKKVNYFFVSVICVNYVLIKINVNTVQIVQINYQKCITLLRTTEHLLIEAYSEHLQYLFF